MNSSFWLNMDRSREKAGKERKAIERECDLANNAFTQGIKRKSSPSADLAYRLARTVGTTVEWLVDGEAGAAYVQTVVRNDPGAIQVPDRVLSIVEALLVLDDRELVGIRANVEALAETKKGREGQEAGAAG